MNSRVSSALDRPWPLVIGLLAVVAVAWYALSRPQTHELRVAFGAALNVPEGAQVQAAGVAVGHATDIRYQDGHAVMKLRINDKVWPLPRGTTAGIRVASVSGNVNRRIELILGPKGAPPLEDGAVIGAAESKPVELDEIFNTFDGSTRASLQQMLKNTGDSLSGHSGQLGRGVARLGQAVPAAGDLITDLEASQQSLTSLISAGDRVTGLLAGRRDTVGDVVDRAGATFQAFGENSRAMQATFTRLPPTLRQITSTTKDISGSLGHVTTLLRDLAPGARQLVPTARELEPTLALLRPTAQEASALASNLTTSAPAITGLLRRGTPFVRDVTPVVHGLVPIANCARAYTPEVAGTLSNWASWNAAYDAQGNVARIFGDVSGLGNFGDTPHVDPSDFAKLGLRYGGLRAPGAVGGQPTYMDECGVGKAESEPTSAWGD